jgi:AraC-like DNA-binding protein
MAAAAGLERRTFLRRFANATGMTPIEYCRAVRIARARELLECGNTPQKEIAQSLGYKDVASFARVFRKVTGLAPGAYRKRFGLSAVSLYDDEGARHAEPAFAQRRTEMRLADDRRRGTGPEGFVDLELECDVEREGH